MEAIVAIALIGTAVIISSALLNNLVFSADHLRVNTELLHEIEASIELMRAGIIPLESGSLSAGGNSSGLQDLSVTAIVEQGNSPGLYQVSVRAECNFRRRKFSRRLVTEIWKP